MLKNHKKLIIGLFLVIAIGTPAWLTFASYSKKWLEARINVMRSELREQGIPLSYSNLKISVTPFSVDATLENPRLKVPQHHFEWQGSNVIVSMRPWDRYTLYLNFPGDHRLVIPQNNIYSLGVLHLEEVQGKGTLNSDFHFDSFTLQVPHLSSVVDGQLQPLSLKDLSVTMNHLDNPLNLKLSVSTQLTNIEHYLKTKPKSHPFTINFIADLAGFKTERPFPKSLAQWRDGGGVLEVRLLKIDWPPILAEIEGTLTLDEEMYPLGSFSSRLYGYKKAIQDMVDLGWIKQKKANVAFFMLDLLSSSDETGKKRLVAPLTLQNKRLSLGPAPLLKLKSIEEGGK
jgi:hypothetical protein